MFEQEKVVRQSSFDLKFVLTDRWAYTKFTQEVNVVMQP